MGRQSRTNKKLEAITSKTIIMGVDIAKRRQWARFVDYRGIEIGKAIRFDNDKSGFETIIAEMEKISKQISAEK